MRPRHVLFCLVALGAPPLPATRADEPDPSIERFKQDLDKLNREGQTAEALAVAESWLKYARERYGEEDLPAVEAHFYCGALRARRPGEIERAAAHFEAGLRACRDRGESHEGWRVELAAQFGYARGVAGDYARALPLYEEAVATQRARLDREADEKKVAERQQRLAGLLNNSAEAKRQLGRAIEAQGDAEEALRLGERLDDARLIATNANTLALVLEGQGRVAMALPLYVRALEARKRLKDARGTALLHNNLGHTYLALGHWEDSERHLREAVAIHRATAPRDPDDLAMALNNLGLLLVRTGRAQEALPLLRESVAIRTALGKSHPKLARTLGVLAEAYLSSGDLPRAREEALKAVAIREAVDPEFPALVGSYELLAAISAREGNAAESDRWYMRSLDLAERLVHRYLTSATEPLRISVAQEARGVLGRWLAARPGIGSDDYDVVLRFKGLAYRFGLEERKRYRQASQGSADTLRRLAVLEGEVAGLLSQPPAAAEHTAWAERLATLRRHHEELTRTLGEASRHPVPRIRASDLRDALPEKAALVDYVRHASGYTAWLLQRGASPRRVDLGAAEKIEESIREFREATLRAPDDAAHDFRASGERLATLLWRPVASCLGEAIETVHIVPDGPIATVPFGALPDADGFVIDHLTIAFLVVAQDVLSGGTAPDPRPTALLVGDVDYGTADGGRGFAPLRATGPEVDELARILGGPSGKVTVLRGADATETRWSEACRGRAILHLGTHAYADKDFRLSDTANLPPSVEAHLASSNPLALAGLALAGANAAPTPGTGLDGRLTALEIGRLDLAETRLVVLSACVSALGTPQSGEGMLGLTWGFRMAGADTVIASLWPVEDRGTSLWMQRMYATLLGGTEPVPAAIALRRTALDWRRDPEALRSPPDERADPRGLEGPRATPISASAPRYWAAFVAYSAAR